MQNKFCLICDVKGKGRKEGMLVAYYCIGNGIIQQDAPAMLANNHFLVRFDV